MDASTDTSAEAKAAEAEAAEAEEAALLTKNFARVGALWGVSFIFGPLTSGLLIRATGSARAACLGVAVFELVAMVIAMVFFKETIQVSALQLTSSA